MVWLSIILTILQLVTKLPTIVETIRDIIELFRTKGPLRAAREAPKLLAALEAKVAECEGSVALTGGACPLASYQSDLRERWGSVA
jgi:hypothetical protein